MARPAPHRHPAIGTWRTHALGTASLRRPYRLWRPRHDATESHGGAAQERRRAARSTTSRSHFASLTIATASTARHSPRASPTTANACRFRSIPASPRPRSIAWLARSAPSACATAEALACRPSSRSPAARSGAGHPPYVICELSGNHNGSLERALSMIDAAAATGADAIKIQTYTRRHHHHGQRRPGVPHQGRPVGRARPCTSSTARPTRPTTGTRPCSSGPASAASRCSPRPFDETAVDLLEALDAPAYKIASFEAIDLPLIARWRHAASR